MTGDVMELSWEPSKAERTCFIVEFAPLGVLGHGQRCGQRGIRVEDAPAILCHVCICCRQEGQPRQQRGRPRACDQHLGCTGMPGSL